MLSALQVFRKYSNSLGPDALALVEDILDEYEDWDESEIEESLDHLAREYNKQDGACTFTGL